MSKKNSDKKLNRFSTIIEIITNLGTIGSWILGAGSAYVLNIQKFPVVVPGINFTLDSNFQFSLVLCSALAYVHFMQNYWKKNKERLSLSDSFIEFSFWELPRLKHPLILIPIVIIIAVCVQIVAKSVWLLVIFLLILGLVIYFVIRAFSYHLSPHRKYEVLLHEWNSDTEWRERWFRRITAKLDKYGKVKVSDLYEVGIGFKEKAKLEIGFALGQYFERYEFDKDLILVKTSQLPLMHPDQSTSGDKSQWIVMYRQNLNERWDA